MTAAHAVLAPSARTALACVAAQAFQHAADEVIVAIAPDRPPVASGPAARLDRIRLAILVLRVAQRDLTERLDIGMDASLGRVGEALRAMARGVLKRTARQVDGMQWIDELEPIIAEQAPEPQPLREHVCRLCGCSDADGLPRHWVTADLCSVCWHRDVQNAAVLRLH